jgi:putative ABC transport system substrate-binding protein
MSRLRSVAGFAAICLSAAALAQPAKVPRVGVLANTIPLDQLVSGTATHPSYLALMEGLRERGWIPGKNVEIVWRSAEGNYARHPQQARELAAECDLIVVFGQGVGAAMSATTRVPIVMATSPVSGPAKWNGVVRIESLARPGGNVTGMSITGGPSLNGKRLELMKLAAPRIRRVAILGHDLAHASQVLGPATRKAAEQLGLELTAYAFLSSPEQLEPVFAQMAHDRIEAVFVMELPATNLASIQTAIHGLAARHRIVAMHEVLLAADSGGLMSYAADIHRLTRRSAHHIDRILRGANPGDLPIEQPTEFELRVNLTAAHAIGLALPQSVLLQATRIID